MTTVEKKLRERFKTLPQQMAPGFCLQVAHRGKKVIDLHWGKTWDYYDLASLTKIIFTTTQLMHSVSQKKMGLDVQLSSLLPWYPHRHVSIKQLLNHSAGNQWWVPFYKKMHFCQNLYEKKQIIKTIIRDTPLFKNNKTVYSDVDFFLLGFLLEDVYELPLLSIWDHFINEQLHGSRLHFNVKNIPFYKKMEYAPTEECAYRKMILQGEVHDENTWMMEGVGAHAGLFGRAQDVLDWGLWLRKILKGDVSYIDSATAHIFFKRSVAPRRGDWGLGFMLPTQGAASCGDFFSSESVGHTGFTGTSFWMDWQEDIIVVLLSNRVHPTRQNEIFRQIRPQIHNAVREELKGSL